jgi:hypothetical protein
MFDLFKKKKKISSFEKGSFEIVFIEDNNTENNMNTVFGISEERKEELVKAIVDRYNVGLEKDNLIAVYKDLSKLAVHQNELCFLIAVSTVHHENQKRKNDSLRDLLNNLLNL